MRWILKDKEGFQNSDIGYVRELTEDYRYEITDSRADLIAVGDYTSFYLNDIEFDYALFDCKTHNKEIDMMEVDAVNWKWLEIDNPPGEISEDAFRELSVILGIKDRRFFTKYIHVNGEEDLLALACILYADNGSYVLYGDPFNERTLVVEVNPMSKRNVLEAMAKYGTWEA